MSNEQNKQFRKKPVVIYAADWLPIASAPKDGRRLIRGYFDGEEWCCSIARWKDGVWYAGKVGDEQIASSLRATHWTDVPAPPESTR